MQLRPGERAPLFKAEDLFGKPIALEAYAGQFVLVSFFRNAACALCNLRVHRLIERYPAYQRQGLEVLAVFESTPERMREHVGRQDAPFPLLADPTARLYERYGVESSPEKVAATMALPTIAASIEEAAANGFALTAEPGSNFDRMPADFLIGPDGALLLVHYANVVTDHLPFEQIDAQLALKTEQVAR